MVWILLWIKSGIYIPIKFGILQNPLKKSALCFFHQMSSEKQKKMDQISGLFYFYFVVSEIFGP